MKKLVYLSVAIAVGIAAASCQQVEPVPSEITEGSSFALNASIEQTKTSINELEVNWEEGDILYLVTTDGTWGKPYSEDKTASTIAEYAYSSESFTSKATIADGSYTFNALYDGSASQKSYHRGASTTYNLQSTQSQDCLNPTGHLKLNDALVGTFNATVPMAAPASVSMSHIFAIMRVDVKNATGADVELKSFEMSAAGATLAGVFTVNFSNSPIDITGKSGQSSSIKVNLTNGAVASGESLPVYFVMAPLADYSGDVTFTVTDVNDMEYTKTVALSNITFSAGSLNTTPYKITEAAAPTCYTWDLSVNSTSEATAERIAWTNSVADMVCTQGEGGTAANNYYPGTGQSSTRFYSKSTLSISPKEGKILTYYVFEAATTNYATALANSTWTNAVVNVVGTTVTVIAEDPSKAVSAVIGATCGFTKVECHTDPAPIIPPVINASPKSFSLVAAGGVCTINYSIDFPVDGKTISATSDQDWVNTFDYSTPGKISFVVDANTGDTRTATVTLSYEGADDVLITVSQNGVSTGGGLGVPYSWTLASGDLGTTGSPLSTVTKGSPELSWNASYSWPSGANQYFGWDSNLNSSRGVQIGSGSSTNMCESLVLSSTSFSGSVSTIVVNGSIASKGNTKVTVRVNGTTLKSGSSESVSLTTTAAAYTFTTNTPIEGTIEITFTNSAAKAFYIKSIAINPAN